MNSPNLQSLLPHPWYVPEAEELQSLILELRKELPAVHPLADVAVEVIAHDGLDDLLLDHKEEFDQVTVVHLTWLGREELPNHPTVEFSGTFGEFRAWYESLLNDAAR